MKEWLAGEIEKVERTYLIKATNMTGPYRREIGLKKEYDGRQLMELLQNADDEAEDIRAPALLIRLEENRLIVANNGKPFSKSGIKSLIDSDNSPKIMRRRKIGYKGLGFRALLNWSESIWIKSGGFSVEFSRQNAVRFFKSLLEKKPDLGTEIQEQFGENYRYEEICPVATLSVPLWKETWDFDTSEYDTYVIVNFSSDEIRQDIQKKINGLGMEVALFLNNLRKIVIQSPGRTETIERVGHGSGVFEEVRILDEEGNVIASKKWRIFHKNDKLPEEFRNAERSEQYEYELRVAVSKHMDDDVNRLFSYFKTEARFPFPAIVHGTFELDESRNHLVNSPVNKFLLKELAGLMIEAAKQLTHSSREVSWNAMRLLAKKGEFDDKIDEMGFYGQLLDAIKSQKLIPVLSNTYMSIEEGPVFYDIPFSEILKRSPDIFPDLALYTEDDGVRSLLSELGIETYEKDALIKKLNKASGQFSKDERADLVLLIAHHHSTCFKGIDPKNMPDLLIDARERVIRSKTRALLPPERAKFTLPDNIKITFISEELFRILRAKAGVKTARELALRLGCFNVEEYGFASVVRRIVVATNRLIGKNEAKAPEYVKNMLSSLIQIYLDESETEKQLPANVTVRVFNRTGDLHRARDTYFGKEYSAGRIMEVLYGQIDRTVFIAGRETLGLEGHEEKDVISFLKWIGVEEYPRIIKKDLAGDDYDPEYEDFVLRNLPYPYKTNWGEAYSRYEDIKKDKQYYRCRIRIDFIKELDDILAKAEFECILAWIHSDERLQRIIREEHEGNDSSFGIWLSNKQYTRDVSPKNTKSFILWKLKTTEWVKTRTSDKKVRPAVCCLSRTIIDMSPLIEVPAYDVRHPVFTAQNLKQEDVEYILEKSGAALDFGRLSDETIYAILGKLEEADPEGKKAKSIYRHVIQEKGLEWDKAVEKSEARLKFAEQGKLLAKRDGKIAYVPVKEVFYVENITFCRQIMERFFIAEIDRRSGKDRVRRIFGAAPLEDVRFTLEDAPAVHHLNHPFQKDLERFKPYVLAYRVQKNASISSAFRTEINRLKKLKVVLCTAVRAKYVFAGTGEEVSLRPFEHIHIPEENTVYLVLPGARHRELEGLRNDFDFCDTLSEILTGVLKVEENRSNFRELYPKGRPDRDRAISLDLDDPGLEQLKRAKELLGEITDRQMEFWEGVLLAKSKACSLNEDGNGDRLFELISDELSLAPEFVKEIYEGIYYEDYSSTANLPLFRELFNAIGITAHDFNRYSREQIDFTEHLRERFANEKFILRNRFKSFVFSILKDKGLQDKEKFLQLNKAFDDFSIESFYDINRELSLESERIFDALFNHEPFKQFGLDYAALLNHQDKDPDSDFRTNRKAFEKRIKETGGGFDQDIESFLEAARNRSLLYFGELDELIRRFDRDFPRPSDEGTEGGIVRRQKKCLPLNGDTVEYDEDDFDIFSKVVDEDLKSNDYEIESHMPARPEEKAGQGPGQSGAGRGGGPATRQAKEIGFLGEKYVYGQLVKKYSKDRVVWASQYARMVNINPEGRDDIGYDMWYLDEKGERHYVEVKASRDDTLAFSISKAEVRFGEQNKHNYEIIMVLNVCDRSRKLLNIGKVFEYGEDESFNNNSKFKVNTDNFRVSFR